MESTITRLISSGQVDAFDILYLDVAIPLSNDAYWQFKTFRDGLIKRDAAGKPQGVAMQILELNPFMSPVASSYIVNRNAIDKISRLMHDELQRGARQPVDAFLFGKIKAGVLKAGFIFPFITSVRIEHIMHSTVRGVPDVTMKFTAANIARQSFFVDCDFAACEKFLEKLPMPPESDRHAQILAKVLEFSLVNPKPDAATRTA
jgi:hypothetical protein